MQAAQQSSPEAAVIPEVSAEVLQHVDRYRDAFDHADHFKHVMIENFLEPSFAEQLLTDFPSFNPRLARNEYGDIGGKAVNTQIREISPVYQRLYAVISSKPFLEFMSRLSGIPDLLIDPKMFGGGTHDNRHGQELDPHVDFNYDESEQLHRRLNLIVYLNKEWETEWGGALEIHSNPRRPQENQIESFDPLFNRAVMFETNEYSWHGFPKIDLPADKRHLSRKSLSIYLYTKDRPAEEIAPMHATF
jgi:Rps23 Pro-64 3,4-dihydroxylase Tpa1-like proline 4-hydroxylase